jgi:hypothetical protein
MDRTIVNAKVGTDGCLHLDLPLGTQEAGKEVRVTVEAVPPAGKMMTASDLLDSDLVGMWAERTDIGDSREFARRLREQAQSRRRGP